jgi:hypothetical protein
LGVFREAMGQRRFEPHWGRYRAWDNYVSDIGIIYLPMGYSAMSYLLNQWMGIEAVSYATVDFPDALQKTVEAVNTNLFELVDLCCTSPAVVVLLTDNFSSDVQPPAFFDKWSRKFYVEAVRRLHDAGKYVAVHIDGWLRGALQMIRETGADCADAVTPRPMSDLTPAQCCAEAGPDFILSGGEPPNLWQTEVPLERFRASILDWLALKNPAAASLLTPVTKCPWARRSSASSSCGTWSRNSADTDAPPPNAYSKLAVWRRTAAQRP